jgi:hypothetical protein
MLALMDRVGVSSRWSEQQFIDMFGNLPSDAEAFRSEAPNFAAMFDDVATKVDQDTAKTAGLHLLDWLRKLKDSGERNLAVNITTESLKEVLGEKYDEALASDALAQSVARTAGQQGEVGHPQEESVSVLQAMNQEPADQGANVEDLKMLPASVRARRAAADGFAAGSAGKKAIANRYFDVAFSAADDSWSQRTPQKDAVGMLQEVSEAAANVDPMNALQRAQHLQDPTAQAISMLAVARVVVTQSE